VSPGIAGALGSARVFDLEQMRYAGAPSHPAHAGDLNEGAQLIAEAVRDDHRWLETMRRLVGIERLNARQVAELETRVTALAK